jgi:hypothetical protein
VHRLVVGYEAAGLTPEERAKNIVEEFRDLSPLAQQELLADFYRIVMEFPELYRLAVAAANERENAESGEGR